MCFEGSHVMGKHRKAWEPGASPGRGFAPEPVTHTCPQGCAAAREVRAGRMLAEQEDFSAKRSPRQIPASGFFNESSLYSEHPSWGE